MTSVTERLISLSIESNEIRSRTLFATHYHELTTLGDELPTVENVHVAADETDGEVTFLRTVRDGPTDRSYGIHVADLAGVPEPVVGRSRTVLDRLRDNKAIEVQGSDTGRGTTQAVFDLGSGQFVSEDSGHSNEQRVETDGSPGQAEDEQTDEQAIDPETEGVLEELQEVDVNETPPVELMSKVQEWQQRVDED